MTKSVFENTMVDMPYTQIEELSGQNTPALIPVSVIEEHGPHLCTGVDMYLTQCVCDKIQENLQKDHIETIIAPPFYWGINSITNGFTGSFHISKQTVSQLLYEIVQNFESWGFQNVFLISFHGDFKHMKTIADTTMKIQENLKIKAYYLAEETIFSQLGFQKLPECFLPIHLDPHIVNIETDFLDVHAGANETSWMLLEYPELTDIETAKRLKPTDLALKDMKEWSAGGNAAKKLTPQGYCGNPANIQPDKIKNTETEVVNQYTARIKAIIN